MENPVDRQLISSAIALAKEGAGKASPNPMVGCVIAKNGAVIGQGFHERFGGPHAEVNALQQAGTQAKGADVYVSLEPCMEFPGKKTPSCAAALAKAGVKRVVIAALDSNPAVKGKGAEFLRDSGIKVEMAGKEMEAQALHLNRAFNKWVETRRPYVALKLAISLDGRIWSPKTSSISNAEASLEVQKLRNELDAIMVGVGTVTADNPRLTCRLPGGRDPLRVIIDPMLRSPIDSRVFDNGNCVVFSAHDADEGRKKQLNEKGIRTIEVKKGREGRLDLKGVLEKLGELKVTSVLVEGGSSVASSFLKDNLADECLFFVAPKILGSGVSAFEPGLELEFRNATVEKFGDNALFRIEMQKKTD